MKQSLLLIALLIFLILLVTWLTPTEVDNSELDIATSQVAFDIIPINHASMVINWNDLTIYNDPVGDPALYDDFSSPDLILISDIHKDHLSTNTMQDIITPDTTVIAPAAVAAELDDLLRNELGDRLHILSNNNQHAFEEILIEAVPMYNLPESAESYHPKGRGNGYLLTQDDFRVYIAGDTDATPEFRSQKNIDVAFVPMNPPYTMDIIEAASGTIDMAPEIVYPYHYESNQGKSNVSEFRDIVLNSNNNIEVRLLDWYQN